MRTTTISPRATAIVLRACTFIALAAPLAGQNVERVPQSVNDPGAITTRQQITHAGVQAVLTGRVHAVSFCGSETEITVALQRGDVYRLDFPTNKVLAKFASVGDSIGIQGMACLPKSGEVLLTLNGEKRQSVALLSDASAEATNVPAGGKAAAIDARTEDWKTAAKFSGTLGSGSIGGASIDATGRIAVVALTSTNEIAVLDLIQKKIERRIRVSIAPFTAAISTDGSVAWVSNWGGRTPGSSEPTAPTGSDPKGDRVLIDRRGIGASGTVSRVDLAASRVTNEVAVGLHPTVLAWDQSHERLYVANGNSDSISVVDAKTSHVVATWQLEPFTQRVAGIAPTALVLSPDATQLYVACGGINAVAVLNTSNGALSGLIPTGWYPSDVAVSPSGKILAISTLLGVGSGSAGDDTIKSLRDELPDLQSGITRRYVHAYRGTVHVMPVPDREQLAAFTRAVAENSHLRLRSEGPAGGANSSVSASHAAPLPVPIRPGDPSPIEHIMYIVKENRSLPRPILRPTLRSSPLNPSSSSIRRRAR